MAMKMYNQVCIFTIEEEALLASYDRQLNFD